LKSKNEAKLSQIFGSNRLPWGISESGKEGTLTEAEKA